MGILDEIVSKRRERIALAISKVPIGELRERIAGADRPLDFVAAVRRAAGGGIRLIAEVKRASPSAGVLREDFSPGEIARIYRERADAISVLTEEDYFQGRLEHLREVRDAAGKPVLRKDFVVDEYQIYEARAAGADAVLLIDAVLDGSQAPEYLHLCRELGLAALYEVHDMRELERALKMGAGAIGINNRDLKTMRVDLGATFALMREIPGGRAVVSESGISTREDVRRLEDAGVDAMLVGTAFMRSPDIAAALDALLGEGGGPRHNGPSP